METILLIGIPAAGKSTFCKRFSDTHVRVNLDTLRSRDREERLVEKYLTDRQDFVVDNTNLLADDRARYIPSAKAVGYRVVGYVFKCRIEDALTRNARREGRACVPDFAIIAFLRSPSSCRSAAAPEPGERRRANGSMKKDQRLDQANVEDEDFIAVRPCHAVGPAKAEERQRPRKPTP